jgi:hypothetical protein
MIRFSRNITFPLSGPIMSAGLSVAALLVDEKAHGGLYSVVQTLFILFVIAVWALGMSIRVYFGPRAQEKRFQDFLAHAFEIPLSHEQTSGYYNSDATGRSRVAAQLLENTFHSKDTARRMTWIERTKGILSLLSGR